MYERTETMKQYQAPEAEIILTDDTDILTASGGNDDEVITLPKVEF